MVDDILGLISRGKTNVVEFWEKPDEDVKLLRTVSAFANCSGGRIIFGVSDDGTVQGIEGNLLAISDNIIKMIVCEVLPRFLFTMDLYRVDGKGILVLNINHGPNTPYYCKKEGLEQGTYVRINASTRRCSPEMLKDLMILGENRSPDMVEVIGGYVLEDDPSFNELCTFVADRSGREVTMTQIRNMGLVKIVDGRAIPTIGYALLTDNQYSHARIECARFRGSDRSVFLDRRTMTGPLYRQIEDAAMFVLNNIGVSVAIEGLFRKESAEIPPEVVRELITNAVVHRCYQMTSSPIFVGVYDDIVEIISPGLLPNGMTADEALRGVRFHRNRALGEFFITAGMMEGWGSGLGRAFRQCLSAGLAEPLIEQAGENLRIIIYRRGVKPRSPGALPLTDTEKRILAILESDSSLSIPEVADRLGLSSSTISNAIKKLKESGRLSREGSKKSGRWKVQIV